MGIAGQEGPVGPVGPGAHHLTPVACQQPEQTQLDSSTPVKEDQPAARTQAQQNILLTRLHGGLSQSLFPSLSLSLVLCFASPLPLSSEASQGPGTDL